MENLKTLVLVALVAAAAALILGALAVLELYKPPQVAAEPSLMESRLTRLERRISEQEATLNRIETAQAGTPSQTQKTENDLKHLREAVQSALLQVSEEIGRLNAKITKLEEQARQKPVAQIEQKDTPPAGDANESPYLTYHAASGDTLASIAKKHSVKEEDIVSLNPPWIDFSHLHPGQTIYIPRD